ncbi:MAG: hypothetical protein KVP17_004214 [Porospora cf. gigantea B]|nr:MAG: hypothetical protein KVP17_004214 [Porospora cf. gigantea B]
MPAAVGIVPPPVPNAFHANPQQYEAQSYQSYQTQPYQVQQGIQMHQVAPGQCYTDAFHTNPVPFGVQTDLRGPSKVSSVSSSDMEAGTDPRILGEHTDKLLRWNFVKKVFGLLAAMLTISFGICLFFTLYEPAAKWFRRNPWVLIVSTVAFLVIFIALACCPGVATKHPINIICLLSLSVAMGFTLGSYGAYFSTRLIAEAIGVTSGVIVVLTFIALFCPIDFTRMSMFGIIGFLVLFSFTLIGIFVRDTIFHLVIAGFGTLLFSFYLMFDIQRIVGGKHKMQFSIDDWVMATLHVYLDIINLFQYIMQILAIVEN